MSKRDFRGVEAKWQKKWEEDGVYQAKDHAKNEKFYGLIEFPYPSGEGLHVGHPRSYTAIDAVTRKQRMSGKNVLFPIGWDAFGLPTENFAIKNKIKPQEATKKNIANFTRQLKSIGFGFDWSREIDTTDPTYYKWTQWQFLKFFNSFYDEQEQRARPIEELPAHLDKDEHRMAYKAASTINWCPRCKIGLANEEAIGGVCERCGNPTEKREKAQWMIRITKYAERLIKDLDSVDYLDKIKAQQINWIGKSEGAFVDFQVGKDTVTVFTTRPDTLFGATYLVMAPEHPLVQRWVEDGSIMNQDEVRSYQAETASKSEIERGDESKDKTGVELKGVQAVNPANGEKIPVWISDYVLATYGTGSIMAVPAHDERDHAFAKKFGLPIDIVVEPVTGEPRENEEFRRSIVAIVRNPKNGKLLSINWGKKGGSLFVGGGLEDGEDPETCAVREIREETGYKNVKFIEKSETVHHHYFAASKNVARNIEAVGLLFELSDEERDEAVLEKDEQGQFTVEWLTEAQAEKQVIDGLHGYLFQKFIQGTCYSEPGIATNSDFLDGLPTWKAKDDMISWLNEQGKGEKATTYKLRDWVFSRQRYWGEPIPIIHCPKCGQVGVPENELPLMLPDVDAYQPTDSGESPLAAIREWVEVKCPNCGGKAERETDTMPNWAGSSWYFLRYCDPHNDKALADPEKLKYWMPVNLYNGGMEHTTLHLLYSRFWYKFLWDMGIVPEECGSEPYAKRRSHGLILAEGGEKMSKSKGNVVNPDDVVEAYGADVFRVYEMFMGPFDQPVPWDTNGIEGVRKFLEKVWNLYGLDSSLRGNDNPELVTLYHQTIKKVTDGIDHLQFNTCISQMMILANAFQDAGSVPESMKEGFLKILAPFAPHMAEEIWEHLGMKGSIHVSGWPTYDPEKLKAATFELVVQVNGKVRAKITVDSDISEEDAKSKALESASKWIEGKTPKQIIYVTGKLVSIVA
ncbi:class I tRNA ligase family protein [Candidatus Uhrbacteria bacterium]|nr:class I tRNA ligase family protein [Candidatus Uhrbacteria bacterium]